MRRRALLFAFVFASVVTGWATSAAAQGSGPAGSAQAAPPPPQPMIGLTTQVPAIGVDSALEVRVKSVSATLRCPVCQGLSLQDSPSELAQQMRGVVREQMAQGKSDDEVRGYFVAKYGDWILLKPKAQGFSTLVYLLPALFVVVGGSVVWLAAKKWSAAPTVAVDAASDPASTETQAPSAPVA
jgi:cytochrome c-type biogenesis protein CcmH